MTTNQKSGCSAIISNLFGDSKPVVEQKEEVFPYRVRDDFLSPAELNFYHILRQAIADSVIICFKVSLGDLFYPKTGSRSNNQAYRNKINRKHVDFLLCDPKSMRPVLGIELDDGSHRRASRQERDRFVDQVFAAAGLPLFRQPVRRSYNVRGLSATLRERAGIDLPQAVQPTPPKTASPAQTTKPDAPLPTDDTAGKSDSPLSPPSSSADEVPLCPRCKQPMVLRTAKKKAHKGNKFWGCRDFPHCRGVRNHT